MVSAAVALSLFADLSAGNTRGAGRRSLPRHQKDTAIASSLWNRAKGVRGRWRPLLCSFFFFIFHSFSPAFPPVDRRACMASDAGRILTSRTDDKPLYMRTHIVRRVATGGAASAGCGSASGSGVVSGGGSFGGGSPPPMHTMHTRPPMALSTMRAPAGQ